LKENPKKQLAMIFNLTERPSVASRFLAEIRNVDIQHDRMRFRRNLERLGEILAYELSKELEYSADHVRTPLGEAPVDELNEQPILLTILRAGLPLLQGFQNYFDRADTGFIGAYRYHPNNDAGFSIKTDYLAIPDINQKLLILVDPMLATGRSIVDTMDSILTKGTPRFVHIVSAIATPEGIRHIKENFPVDFKIWTGAVDQGLNDKSYIVPGLGDAGDLSFGNKL
jgi:uracil phosphoribosyltransferase